MLEYVPARFKVIRTVRPKLSCACCSRIVQEPAPHRPIDRGLAGPGLLAHVLVAKYADHLPLYRQSEIYAREGVELDRSTMADWVGGASRTLRPLVDALKSYVLSAEKLHGDDVPVPVLEPGNGKTKTGRLWTYVRDDRPAGSKAASAVWFAYSPDRKGEHPASHLKNYRGILQADGFAGFNRLYETGSIFEAACWAHVKKKVLRPASGACVTGGERGAGTHRATVWDRERDPRPIADGTKRSPAGEITAVARSHAYVAEGDHVEAVEEIGSGEGDPLCAGTLAALMVFVDDGRVEMDNNAAERALRTVAIGRKNYLFAGSDAGGERAAAIYSLLGSAKLNGIDPEAYHGRGAAPHRRSSDQPDRGTSALEPVPGGSGEGRGRVTLKSTSIEIVSTIPESWTRFKMGEGLRG